MPYDNRYFTDLTYRIDGASQFGSNNRYAPFYSEAQAGTCTKKNSSRHVQYIDRLKLPWIPWRYRKPGVLCIPATGHLFLHHEGSVIRTGSALHSLPWATPTCKWQETNKLDIGLEAGFLNDRIYIMADYYQENTSNLLSSVELPFSNGFTDYVERYRRSCSNEDGELSSHASPSSAKMPSRLLWSVSGNIAHNEDKIVKLSQALKAANDKLALQYDYTAECPQQDLSVKVSRRSHHLCRSFTRHRSQHRKRTLSQQVWTGNLFLECCRPRECWPLTTCRYRGNFSTMLRYQGFTLNASFGYRFGGQIYNQTLIDKIENADRFFNDGCTRVLRSLAEARRHRSLPRTEQKHRGWTLHHVLYRMNQRLSARM